MTYHLHTQSTKAMDAKTINLASQVFPSGFTMYHAIGYWHGMRERSSVLEIAGRNIARKVRKLAGQIRRANRQNAVLIERSNSKMEVINQ